MSGITNFKPSTALFNISDLNSRLTPCPLQEMGQLCELIQIHETQLKLLTVASFWINVVAILMNVVDICLICKQKKRTRTENILISLSIADLSVAVTFVVTKVLINFQLTSNNDFLYVQILTFSMTITSMAHATLMTGERLIAVVYPFWHRARCTQKKMTMGLLIIWLYLASTYLLKVLLFKFKVISFFTLLTKTLRISSTIFLLMSILIFSSYAIIVKKQRSFPTKEVSNQAQESRKRRERRLMTTSGLISTSCFICYLPYIVAVWFGIGWVFRFQLCVHLAALLNPLVYFFSYRCMNRMTRNRANAIQEGSVESTL